MNTEADNQRWDDIMAPVASEETPYLGSREDVQDILRGFMSDILEIRSDGQNVAERIEGTAREVADVFLGKDPEAARPVELFNAPGGIDRHLADQLNIAENSPEDTLVVALATMASSALDIFNQNATQEQWQEGAQALLDEYTSLFIGLVTKDDA